MVKLEREGDVFVLRVDAGENRFGPETLGDWNRALDEVEASEGPKALVTTGTTIGADSRTDCCDALSDRVCQSAAAAAAAAFSWSEFSGDGPVEGRAAAATFNSASSKMK